MTTYKNKFVFNEDTIEAHKYESMKTKYEFVRHECDWDGEEDFKKVLYDFERQVEEAEIRELHDMLDNWEKSELVIQLRMAWRERNLIEKQLIDLKHPRKYDYYI